MDFIFNYTDYSFFSIMYFLLLFGICLKIILDTQSPSKALAYIFLVVIFPLFGIIFYFSVGINYRKQRLYRKKLNLDEKAYPELEKKVLKFSSSILEKNKIKLKNFYPLAQFSNLENLTSDNNQVQLLVNGEEKFPSLIDSIKNAKHHIHIEYYIYENDDIGTEIGELLMGKAKQGVEVRFIYDDFGSKSIRKKFIQNLKNEGVETMPFYKVKLMYFANRLNYRNHRKIVVIDGIVGYVGGINVSDKYYNNGKKDLFWRDTHLKITGVSVLNLQHTFLTDWNFCAKQDIPFSKDYFPIQQENKDFGNQLVQIIASGPDSNHATIMYSLIQAIMLSEKEVLITTPYFIPEKTFLDALIMTRLRGVTIKIIVPYSSDSLFVNTTCRSYYQDLLEAGIEVYLYKKGFIHAKTMVCDEFVSIVGTANLDNRSFDLNFEVNATVYDDKLAKEMKQNFENDLKNSEKINLESWKSRPLYIKALEKIAHLCSPLL
ncbi:MAG: cardiolipin synthase [Flavobacteriales bacterium]|nr:cardiolipin synthase [Flavobacteriales bacterium]